jgi:hypothetical protein
MPWRAMIIGWQTTEHGRCGLGFERGGSLSYARINFHKTKEEEWLLKEIKRKKLTIRN